MNSAKCQSFDFRQKETTSLDRDSIHRLSRLAACLKGEWVLALISSIPIG